MLFIFPIIAFIFIYLNINQIPSCKEAYKLQKDVMYSGTVQNKYIDTNNHMLRTIELTNNGGMHKLVLSYDKSNLFDYVSKKDSIVKSKGGYGVLVYRNGSITEIKLDYKCRD
ncbi:hypothetical protein U6A24_19795 [Aquimarina gracilis]|uniref:Uncharacterized protein n=1 Tax=Aquimarina gracilis TaxID=874422 RepID=A0ABU6A105_9FLAO|nr:hypothetical protein [Aquimarina gracilis]MEB3347730.1 hypothetical protein [Aquimarina gracilis]